MHGQPSPRDEAEFERWYGGHPSHRQAYDRIAADWADRYGMLARTSVGRHRAGIPRRERARPVGFLLVAASFAVLLVASLLLLGPGTEPAAQAEVIATAIGEIRTVTLPDDSRMTLDTGSRVAVRYRQEDRRVELQEGRARFTVRDSPNHPFVVEANGGEIVAQGTTFDVSLAPGGATVALIEGEIEVQVPARESPTLAGRRIHAGERVLVHSNGDLRDVTPASEAELRWPSGMLEFLNTPLGQAAVEANRYSSRKIRIGHPAIARLRLTGTYRAGDTAGLARSLAAAFSLRADEQPGGDIILLPPG
jgi:transmembrane sensor